jgi:hypothetical protein
MEFQVKSQQKTGPEEQGVFSAPQLPRGNYDAEDHSYLGLGLGFG